jgi:hypothetical protein
MPRKIFNLERDIKSADWVVDKIRQKEIYAQNLYAALCNNDFAPKDSWCILKNIKWNCTWTYAANIISEIRQDDNYSNWYGSGTGFRGVDFAGFVEESYVTDEVASDIDQIGWLILTSHRLHFPE